MFLAIALGNLAMAAQKPPSSATLFAEHCASCHGTKGEGSTAPSLQTPLQHGNTLPALTKVIRDGIPNTLMPPSGLSDAQNKALAKFVLSMQKSKGGSKRK